MELRVLLEEYLTKELGIADGIMPAVVGKIQKYDDIYEEFCYWLKNRNYDKKNPLVVGGYTAKQIYQLNPKLDGIGVYNFLITLREAPERAEKYIKSGFKRR